MSSTFHPALYHTSEVLIDDHTSTPFARLTFSVLPDDGQVDGVYQLWTDLPNLKEDGYPLHGPGEWHEITFTSLPSAPSSDDSSASVTLNSRSIPSEPSSPLYAIFHITSSPATYSYTLRQAKSSGEIIWLGSDGSNGTVIVKQGETSTEVVIEAGTWDGTLKHMEAIKWGGVAVVLGSDDSSSSSSSIVQLPTAEPVNASLVVAVGIKPTDTIPFFQLSSDAKSQGSITRNIAMAVAGSSKKPLEITPSTVLPSKSRQGTFGRCESGSLPSAIQKALAEQSKPAFDIVDSGGSHVVLSPARTEQSVNAELVLLAYSPEKPQIISLTPPSHFDSSSPILCQIAASRQLKQASSSPLTVKLGAGLIADVLRFAELSELRVAGGSDSIWVCAPSAQSVEVGEEEFGEVHANGGSEVAIAGEPSEVASSAAPPSEADTELPSTRTAHDNESEYEAGDEDDSVAITPRATGENATSWFFRMLDSLLVRIWSWIFSPIQAQVAKTSERITAGDGDAGAETEGETAVESPTADERTPLLATPGLSRSTSSTFNSPLNSPESVFTLKAKQSLETFAKDKGMNNDETNAIQPKSALGLTGAHPQQYPAGTVTVRSYIQFTFTSPPPFAFYLPADSGDWQNKVKFSAKTQVEAEWTGVEVAVKGDEGGAVEVLVGEGKSAEEGAVWQVQVERL